jgi:hypothetical protein
VLQLHVLTKVVLSGTLAVVVVVVVVVVGLVGTRKAIGQAQGTAVEEEAVVDKGKVIDRARGTAAARPLQGILHLPKRRKKKEREASACCWGCS